LIIYIYNKKEILVGRNKKETHMCGKENLEVLLCFAETERRD
jgi:hypothetical protein